MQSWWEAVKQALQAAGEGYVNPQKSQMGSRNNFFSSLPNCIGSLICGAVLLCFFLLNFLHLHIAVMSKETPSLWFGHTISAYVLFSIDVGHFRRSLSVNR